MLDKLFLVLAVVEKFLSFLKDRFIQVECDHKPDCDVDCEKVEDEKVS